MFVSSLSSMSSLSILGFKGTLLLPALSVLLVSCSLFVLGRIFGSVLVLAAAVHWLLIFGLVIGVRSQLLNTKSGSTLPARRVFVALLFLMVAACGTPCS